MLDAGPQGQRLTPVLVTFYPCTSEVCQQWLKNNGAIETLKAIAVLFVALSYLTLIGMLAFVAGLLVEAIRSGPGSLLGLFPALYFLPMALVLRACAEGIRLAIDCAKDLATIAANSAAASDRVTPP